MIRFTHDTATYGIGFRHFSMKEAVPLFDSKGIPQKSIYLETIDVRYTSCSIYRLGADGKPLGPVLAKQSGRCSPLDNFEKEAGRKVALTRTLLRWTEKLDPVEGRTIRAAAWTAYLDRNEDQEQRRLAKVAAASDAQRDIALLQIPLGEEVTTYADGAK